MIELSDTADILKTRSPLSALVYTWEGRLKPKHMIEYRHCDGSIWEFTEDLRFGHQVSEFYHGPPLTGQALENHQIERARFVASQGVIVPPSSKYYRKLP